MGSELCIWDSACQTTTVLEGTTPNAGDTVGDRYARQTSAANEGKNCQDKTTDAAQKNHKNKENYEIIMCWEKLKKNYLATSQRKNYLLQN